MKRRSPSRQAAQGDGFSLIASCQLHGLDAETYLAEIICIVPLWLRDRYLELAPKYWAVTGARLDPAGFERELGAPDRPAAAVRGIAADDELIARSRSLVRQPGVVEPPILR